MNPAMHRPTERALTARAVELGRSANPAALPELIELLATPSAETRKLAASAIGKLAGLADAPAAVTALTPLLHDAHPQVRQYTVKAFKAYGTASERVLQDLRDLAANPDEKEYNRRDAVSAIATIEEAVRIKAQGVVHRCQRCDVQVAADEYARSQRMFQRTFCDKCFDDTYIQRRNFDTRVEVQKTIRTTDGTLVQSDGERKIAEWLAAHRLVYRYDDRLRIIDGRQIRPDFYLPEFDVYIEYWGMDTLDYKIGMLLKQQMYQHAGKKLISIYPEDKPTLNAVLADKLSRYARIEHGPTDSAGAPSISDRPGATSSGRGIPPTPDSGVHGALRSKPES